MKKLIIFLLTALLLTITLNGCGGNESKTGPVAKAAKDYFYKANLYSPVDPVENVEVLSIKIDKEHAIVKVKVSYRKGASYMPSEKNYKVFLEKHGDVWRAQFSI